MKRILFVDDDPNVLAGLKASLWSRRMDWDMHFANGGAIGIDRLLKTQFDVLVTDIRMPGVDGIALLTRARADSPQTIRIALSGYANEVQSLRLVSLVHLYLSKPCEPKRLEASIERCLSVQTQIQSDDLRGRLGLIADLTPMPSTFAALLGALEDPSVDAHMVARVIQNDPGVSAKVLQVCNSAFFRLPRRVSNVQQAVSYLGLSTVRSITIAAEVFKAEPILPANLDLELLQRHALGIATIAKSVAAKAVAAKTVLPDDAFLAGLLHDVGLLALGRLHPQKVQCALEAVAGGMSLAEAEQTHVGVEHATAGAYLLGLWGLPYEVVATVARHGCDDSRLRGGFNGSHAVAIAHALLSELRPRDVPAYETASHPIDDDYLQAIGYPKSWASLKKETSSMLSAENPS
jgi:HD-like signal output (HDOD) protein/ActR/RegA family two-component response regulator